MNELRSKCCGARVDKGIAVLPIMYQKSIKGEACSYICRKRDRPAEIERKHIAQGNCVN